MSKTFTAAASDREIQLALLERLDELKANVRFNPDGSAFANPEYLRKVGGSPDRSLISRLDAAGVPRGGGDGADLMQRAFFASPSENAVTAKLWDWFRCIATSPIGGAHQHQLALSDPILKRVLATTDNESGGYLIPPGFLPQLVADPEKESELFAHVRKLPVSSNTGQMPKVGSGVDVFWGTENTDIDETEPDFENESWTIRRLNAIAKMSRELMMESNPNIVAVVTDLFTKAIFEERDRMIAIGSGSGRPIGIYSASGITDVSSITSLTYANLLRLKFSLARRYHKRSRWTMNSTVLRNIQEIVDTTGRPIFRESAIRGEESTILGLPFSIEDSFPNCYIGLGDLAYYVWFDRQRYAIERTTEAGEAWRKHQLWIKVTEYADGKPVLPPTSPMVRTRALAGIT